MAYEVLARKWRPRQFADVVGQEHVTRTLANALSSGRIANAYLFIGSRGIGKTTLTRIFAKALNCEKGPTASPCDECEQCRSIMAGNSIDVLEIDGASHNKVEDVRMIIDGVQFKPASSRYKIFIIDECHMLTAAAWNALLKTLEEPPPYVRFIFATTEGDKLLPTIISRCQRFDLRRIPSALIARQLKKISDIEKIEIDPDALLAIARGADGGMRDALSALDQLVAFTEGRIAESDVLGIFGLVSRKSLEDLAGDILKGDAAAALKIVEELDSSGKDLRRLVAELLNHFRNVLVCQYVGEGGQVALDAMPEQEKVLREQAALATPEGVLRVTELLVEADGRIRYALSKRVLLETALVRCCRAAVSITIEQILRRLNALQSGHAPEAARSDNGRAIPAAPAAPAPAPVSAAPAPAKPAAIPPQQVREAPRPAPAVPAVPPVQISAPPPPPPPSDAALYKDPVLEKAVKMFDGDVVAVE